MTSALALWSASVLVVAVLAGCAPEDPYSSDRAAPSAERPSVRTEGPTGPPESGELPGGAPRELLDEPSAFPEAGETPQDTLRLAARLAGNWTSASVPSRLGRLAGLCVGQAHAEFRQAAVQSTVDRQQRGARSRASVEAIGVRGQGQRRRGLVVTREHIRVPDLPSEGWRYRVTVAALERRADGWVISRWAPQP